MSTKSNKNSISGESEDTDIETNDNSDNDFNSDSIELKISDNCVEESKESFKCLINDCKQIFKSEHIFQCHQLRAHPEEFPEITSIG